MIDHRSYHPTLAVVKLKPEKNSFLNVIRTHDLICASAVKIFNLYLKLITFCVPIPFWRRFGAKDLATN